MTHISKKVLNPKTQKQLFVQFTNLFASANKKQHAAVFSAIFSTSEKIMFIKRLAIVLLLSESYSAYRIAKTLLVSDSTVRVIKLQYETGRFNSIVATMKSKSFDMNAFWKTIEILLSAGLPPRGKGRWKWLYKNH